MLSIARRGLHAARFHLTKWRRDAIAARETLVRDMFQAGRTIVDVGLALMARMEAEQSSEVRQHWVDQRDGHDCMLREWQARQADWAYLYNN